MTTHTKKAFEKPKGRDWLQEAKWSVYDYPIIHYLYKHRNRNEYITNSELREATGLSRQVITKHTSELYDNGFIERKGKAGYKAKPKLYQLLTRTKKLFELIDEMKQNMIIPNQTGNDIERVYEFIPLKDKTSGKLWFSEDDITPMKLRQLIVKSTILNNWNIEDLPENICLIFTMDIKELKKWLRTEKGKKFHKECRKVANRMKIEEKKKIKKPVKVKRPITIKRNRK